MRPDRQTLLFSATFKKRVEKLARDVLTDPVKIVQGDVGEANEDITQHMIVFSNPTHKWNWLICKIVEFLSQGSVLIFVTKKADAEQVAQSLNVKEHECLLLHGDIEQAERNKVITKFKKREVDILVATDVAARGLDIPHIRTVVNYDIARDIDTHTHRIGRTGRAGEKGTAYTLVTDKDKEFAGHLVRNLEGANQTVPDDLLELAMQSSWFRNSRFKGGKGKLLGGSGLGYKERPGLGMISAKSSDTNASKPSPAPSGAGGGRSGGTNRFAAMKEAFKSQYNTQVRRKRCSDVRRPLIRPLLRSSALPRTEHGQRRCPKRASSQPPCYQVLLAPTTTEIRPARRQIRTTKNRRSGADGTKQRDVQNTLPPCLFFPFPSVYM